MYEIPFIDKPYHPKPVTFKTDSGHKFGLMICFDVNYAKPANDLLEQGVDAIILQVAWVDELPFLTGLVHESVYTQSVFHIRESRL